MFISFYLQFTGTITEDHLVSTRSGKSATSHMGTLLTPVQPTPNLFKLVHLGMPGFPHGLENLEKWEGIFQSEKSRGILNRLEKSWKSYKIPENSGNFRQILFVIFSDI